MAKQVVAATNIMHNGENFPVGKPLDTSKFTKDDLTRLYERGAIRIVDASEVERERQQNENDLSSVTDPGMVAPPSVPSDEDAKKSEAEKAEGRSAMAQKENDPNATPDNK